MFCSAYLVCALFMIDGDLPGDSAYLLEWNAFDATPMTMAAIEADCSELLNRQTELTPAVQGAIFLRRGVSRKWLEKKSESNSDFKEAIRLAPEDLDAQYFYGRCLIEEDEHQEAFKLAKKLIETHPTNFRGQLLLADYYHAKSLPRKEIQSLTTAIGTDSNIGLLYAYRARAFAELHEWDECLTDSKQALALLRMLPQVVRNKVYKLRVLSYFMLRKYDEAIRCANQFKENAPNDPVAWGILFAVYVLDAKPGFALKTARAFRESFPTSAKAHEVLALAECHFGYFADAETHVREAIRLDSEANSYYWCDLATIAWRQGNWKLADEAFKKGVQNCKEDETPIRQAFFWITCPDEKCRNSRFASDAILNAKRRKRHVEDPILYLIYACLAADEGDFDEALREIESLKKSDNCNAELRSQATSLQSLFESKVPYRVAEDYKERTFDLPVVFLWSDPSDSIKVDFH